MMREIKQIAAAVGSAYHNFWFKPSDPIVVSTLRVFVGGMLLYTMLVWGLELKPFFLQDGGWQSSELVEKLEPDSWAMSFLWLVPDNHIVACHAICTGIIFLYWIGLATPITKWLAAAIIVSYANRVPLANYGLDQINTLLVLYLCAGPCGARLSVDRLLKSWYTRRRGREIEPAALTPWAGLSTRLVQVHLSFIYLWAGLSKLQGVSWWNGQAVWRAAANYEYQQVPLTWMADFPWMFQLATVSTWMWEISFIFLVWNRKLRLPVLLIGLSMHIGIGMFMGMWTFGLIMCFAYITFIPAAILHKIFGRLGTQAAEAEATPADSEQPSTTFSSSLIPSSESVPVAEGLPLGSTLWDHQPTPAASQPSDAPVDHDSLVVYVDPSLSSRYRMSRLLKKSGYQCLGVDAWPEAVEVFNQLGARSVVCNATRLQQSELSYWTKQLITAERTSVPKCIALVDPKSSDLRFRPSDEACIVAPLPLSARDIAAILDGHVPLHLNNKLSETEKAPAAEIQSHSPAALLPSDEENQ